MTSPVAVSVVIPTYNRCAMLRNAVESVLAQDGAPPFELVIVDNNSRDGTAQEARAWSEKHPGTVRHVAEPEQGNAHARNRGVRTAAGPIIAFLDDDVVVARDWLATLAGALASRPELSFVGGRVMPAWPEPPPAWLTPTHWMPLAVLDYGPEELIIDRHQPRGLVTANFAVRRDVFDEVGGFSPALQRVPDGIGSMEDHEFLQRICRSGKRGAYLPRMVATSPVDRERLSKAYHRRWHTGHGHFYAVMRDPEWERSRFRIAGVPSHLYREILSHGFQWLRTTLEGNAEAAFLHECELRFIRGFIGQRWRAA